jgi:ribose 5-phosphate isomerase
VCRAHRVFQVVCRSVSMSIISDGRSDHILQSRTGFAVGTNEDVDELDVVVVDSDALDSMTDELTPVGGQGGILTSV